MHLFNPFKGCTMDIEKPFTFFTEDKRSHLELIIPGHPTQKTWKIRWDKNLEHDFRAIKKEERAQVVRYYQEHGFLNGYDKKTLEDMRIGGRGWIISSRCFACDLPPCSFLR